MNCLKVGALIQDESADESAAAKLQALVNDYLMNEYGQTHYCVRE